MLIIRNATFKRSRFNSVELHEWQRRTGAKVIRVSYSDTHTKVTYFAK